MTCLTLALVAHGLLILLPLKQKNSKVTPNPSPSLKVRLSQINQEPDEPTEVVRPAELEPDKVSKQSATQVAQNQPEPNLAKKHSHLTNPMPDRTRLVAAIKSELTKAKPTYHSFSLSDFTPDTSNTEEMSARARLMPDLLTRGTQSYSVSQAGQTTEVIHNQKGEAYCWQQRGIHDETLQWYRVPLALCGHLQ